MTTSTVLLSAAFDTVQTVLARDAEPAASDVASEFLTLLQDPFGSQLSVNSVWAALASSVGITAAIALVFSFVRPFNTAVYAPKLKHADDEHAPPPLGRGIFAWFGPLWKTSEQDLVSLVGLDAAVFLRFTKMCRNLFITLAVLGCSILIPINTTNTNDKTISDTWILKITPSHISGYAHWGTVAVAWIFNFVVAGFLWWNYTKVLKMRRKYFESGGYQHSLHARTLMLYDIPKKYANDEGIARIIDQVVPNASFARTAIARDVKILPDLIAEHSEAVRALEKVLAIYLKDAHNLPASRPASYPSKKDRSCGTYPKGQKVDAIEYWTQRIKTLEVEIKEVRQSVDKRNSMQFGFASYADISEAHAIAYTCRKKKVHGSTVVLAPKPNDIIWANMPLSPALRNTRRWWNNLWIAILTLLWIAPNAMIAIFLVNLSNLGHLWPAFDRSLKMHTMIWGVVQGIASPAVTSIVYLLLPVFFRRMSIRAGDQTKTGRERHVVAKLYSFFVFNNLIVFSIFSALWTFITGVVKLTNKGDNAWKAILENHFGATLLGSLCSISPYWIAWLLQRQLGAAIDLAQLWTLVYSFAMRKFLSPTPRELIELTAPPAFDYASYYNYFLFYATVALSYATIQPLVLPAAALYFTIDVYLKKYLLLYIFVTKTESGGMFWRMLFNRVLFAAVLFDLVAFLVTWVQGEGTHVQAIAVAPLPFLVLGFKIYCAASFDDKIHFYATRTLRRTNTEGALNVKEESLRNDRLASKFGHPALYKPLITPMVHAKAQNILASVYQGRLTDGREAGGGDLMSVSGYSDTYVMDSMASGKPGKLNGMPGFEVVPESKLDFEYYKNRLEFADGHGAGDLYGNATDFFGPGTPAGASVFGSSEGSRPGTPTGGMGFAQGVPTARKMFSSRSMAEGYRGVSTTYESRVGRPGPQQGQHSAIAPGRPSVDKIGGSKAQLYAQGGHNGSDTNLVLEAAAMPMSPPSGGARPGTPGTAGSGGSDRDSHAPLQQRAGSMGGLGLGSPRAPGSLGGGPYGYGNLAQEDLADEPVQDPSSFDYFRGGAARRASPGQNAAPTGTPRPGSRSHGRSPSGPGVWGGNMH